MRNSKTVYLETINNVITAIFLILIFVSATQAYTNWHKNIRWIAMVQFVIAGGTLFYLVWHDIMVRYMGHKYIHFDETGVEFKVRYIGEAAYYHWEDIRAVSFRGTHIHIELQEGLAGQAIKVPLEKSEDIRHAFQQFSKSHDVEIEFR